MSPEEAGQIILEDEQWVNCPACDGSGIVVIEPAVGCRAAMNYMTNEVVAARECEWCDLGHLVNPYYLRACKVLGLPYKPNSWVRTNPFVGRISRVYETRLEVVEAIGGTTLYKRGASYQKGFK